MTTIGSVALEFLRPGPTHNQLLSRLTPYLAVCDSRPAATFSLPFDHWEMEQALSVLSYQHRTNIREAQILQVADALGQVLGSVPTLLAAVAQSQHQDPSRLTHLRLVLSASELALLPFEMANAPQGFPGERHAMLLQPVLPITLTRELRRSVAISVNWNRPVRILFISAAPDGMAKVPMEQHLLALTQALQPLLCATRKLLQPDELRRMITVLTNPSLRDIRKACEESDFTHVHVLAHGDCYQFAGQSRFGVALCEEDRHTKHVVDGTRLADALRPQRQAGRGLAMPTLVTLMTCESGRQGSVLVPGGSLAHELHEAGIPWVIASQFPLSMAGSVLAAEEIYGRLLLGEDPRVMLYALRRKLFTESPDTHDWASLLTYASIPPDFDRQVRAFRRTQADLAMDRVFRQIDTLLFPPQGSQAEPAQSTKDQLAELLQLIARYRALVEYAAPPLHAAADLDEHAEVWGLLGSMDRNVAHIQQHTAPGSMEWRHTMARSRKNYLLAANRSLNSPRFSLHYLSVSSLLGKGFPKRWWTIAYSAARLFLRHEHRAWAYASIIELELLAILQAEMKRAHGHLPHVPSQRPSDPKPSAPDSQPTKESSQAHSLSPSTAAPVLRHSSATKAIKLAKRLHHVAPDHPATRKLVRQLLRYRQYLLKLSEADAARHLLFGQTVDNVLHSLHSQAR